MPGNTRGNEIIDRMSKLAVVAKDMQENRSEFANLDIEGLEIFEGDNLSSFIPGHSKRSTKTGAVGKLEQSKVSTRGTRSKDPEHGVDRSRSIQKTAQKAKKAKTSKESSTETEQSNVDSEVDEDEAMGQMLRSVAEKNEENESEDPEGSPKRKLKVTIEKKDGNLSLTFPDIKETYSYHDFKTIIETAVTYINETGGVISYTEQILESKKVLTIINPWVSPNISRPDCPSTSQGLKPQNVGKSLPRPTSCEKERKRAKEPVSPNESYGSDILTNHIISLSKGVRLRPRRLSGKPMTINLNTEGFSEKSLRLFYHDKDPPTALISVIKAIFKFQKKTKKIELTHIFDLMK